MPLIKVQTSIEPDQTAIATLLKRLSASLAKHTGKPEAYVMTAFEPNRSMTFGGTFDPTCYIEVKSVGTMTPTQTQAMSREFCDTIASTLGVPIDRTYIEFNDAKGSMWGWNGSTF
ncbi:hypothetical protein H6F67_02440 [Microcoleus sp. FACHB-1515]|uniref:phenylpyruvate tautomerase MIF-related protein n=1 Tax=Cyanophyceae TaxID=3028117 RepID=UPI001685E980|nr:phenylpyruvate tautomerase MIF-related protein [Microcoleus sp. FACHB-1515]MBD2088720.1 hypothetical protein [Microcoleus sp. FACHB-1515]